MLRIFSRQIFDPADAVTIFQEWLNQQNIGLMFPDQFARVKETMCTAANVISLVASDDCGHALFTDTSVSDDHDPPWLSARATWRALFHTY